MKITLLFTLLLSQLMFGQNFPGNNPNLLLGKDLKILPKIEGLHKFGYEGFFEDDAMDKVFECCDSYKSKYNNMVGRVFKVTEVTPINDVSNDGRYKIKLLSDKQETLYFEYESKYEHTFPFEVIGGLTVPPDFYCSKIETETDKFSETVRKFSPILDGIVFTKSTDKNESVIYLSIQERGSTLTVGKKGVTLLLEGGKKIERPSEDINVKVNTGGTGYMYSAIIELTPKDIELLTKHEITDSKVYIYDGTVENGSTIKEYLKCIIK